MNNKILKIIIFLCSVILFISVYTYIKVKREIDLKKNTLKGKELITADSVSSAIKTTEYGYWEIFDELYGGEEVRIIDIDSSEGTSKKVNVNVEINGGRRELNRFIDNIKTKENFACINKLSIRYKEQEEFIGLNIGFLRNK